MKKLTGLTVLMLMLANIGTLTKADAQEKSTVAARDCPKLVKKVKQNRAEARKAQKELGARLLASHYTPKTSCKYTKWVARLWKTRTKHRKSRLVYLAKVNRTPVKAMRYVQKAYPGTYDWLYSCSRGEGQHGPWQWNKPSGHYGHYYLKDYPYRPAGSSGAGGPWQFLESTYNSFNDEAFRVARARGLVLPPKYDSWYSILGQAVVAAYVRHDLGVSTSHWHWAPSIDPLCY